VNPDDRIACMRIDVASYSSCAEMRHERAATSNDCGQMRTISNPSDGLRLPVDSDINARMHSDVNHHGCRKRDDLRATPNEWSRHVRVVR
jgi:hypothetical protein